MALPTVTDLLGRIRRAMSDFPQVDTMTSLSGTAGTALVVGISGSVKVGAPIVIDQEQLMPTAVAGTAVTVVRAWGGTTAATHTAAAAILVNPRYSPAQLQDALSEAYRALWPYWFKWIEDEATVVTNVNQADYAIPSAFGESGVVTDMQILPPGLNNYGWTEYRWFRHREGTTVATGSSVVGRAVQLLRVPAVGTYIRMIGIAPFTGDVSTTLDSGLLDSAVPALVMYACHVLASAGESQRLNNATATNIGPTASQPGQNQSNSQYHLQRFNSWCQTHAQRYPTWRTRRRI